MHCRDRMFIVIAVAGLATGCAPPMRQASYQRRPSAPVHHVVAHVRPAADTQVCTPADPAGLTPAAREELFREFEHQQNASSSP